MLFLLGLLLAAERFGLGLAFLLFAEALKALLLDLGALEEFLAAYILREALPLFQKLLLKDVHGTGLGLIKESSGKGRWNPSSWVGHQAWNRRQKDLNNHPIRLIYIKELDICEFQN
ncbi:restriction endonuclease type I [Striga asiatica]|uniref:Restriction endonuclease type I n=1 Tax=Striga asiatica TaxID=4170 RepID=A0A5A7RD67_STRAF|nr:restriction endonuclease type I [Striga asiatica]